ncbi:unnamed protein product [Effrenium voratum]|nr:unnamed protein product [Effrenium voratum]
MGKGNREALAAESLALGSCTVDLAFLKRASRSFNRQAVPCDPEILVKVVAGEVPGLLYEWDIQDGWDPIHFTKVRVQVLAFQDLEITELSKNRTAVALVPAVLQLETGSQAWDAAASRRDKTEWQGLAAPGADGTFGANAAALPRNFREVSDLLAPHRLVLKHSAAKGDWNGHLGRCDRNPSKTESERRPSGE